MEYIEYIWTTIITYLKPPTLGEIFPSIEAIDKELELEELTNAIESNEKFQEYQDKFSELTPSRDVYLDGNNLIIETNTSPYYYSIQEFRFDWSNPDDVMSMYELLERKYKVFNN